MSSVYREICLPTTEENIEGYEIMIKRKQDEIKGIRERINQLKRGEPSHG